MGWVNLGGGGGKDSVADTGWGRGGEGRGVAVGTGRAAAHPKEESVLREMAKTSSSHSLAHVPDLERGVHTTGEKSVSVLPAAKHVVFIHVARIGGAQLPEGQSRKTPPWCSMCSSPSLLSPPLPSLPFTHPGEGEPSDLLSGAVRLPHHLVGPADIAPRLLVEHLLSRWQDLPHGSGCTELACMQSRDGDEAQRIFDMPEAPTQLF